jgi:hypothetical protein
VPTVKIAGRRLSAFLRIREDIAAMAAPLAEIAISSAVSLKKRPVLLFANLPMSATDARRKGYAALKNITTKR